MLTLIVLAAGLSTRCEKYKMLLPLGDKTVIQSTIDNYVDFVDEIMVVTGYNKDLIEENLHMFEKVQYVHNEDYMSGMYSSVLKGLSTVKGDVLLTPGDIPLIGRKTITRVIESDGSVRKPSYNMKAGHPVYIKENVVREIVKGSYENLRDALVNFEINYISVDDAGILMDIDTMDDYGRLLRRDGN